MAGVARDVGVGPGGIDGDVVRVQQPQPRFALAAIGKGAGRGIGNPAACDVQMFFAGCFNRATVAAQRAAARCHLAKNLGRVVRPNHHQPAVALQISIGVERGGFGNVGEIAGDDVRVQPLPAAAHLDAAATQRAAGVDDGIVPHGDAAPRADADVAAHALAMAAVAIAAAVVQRQWRVWNQRLLMRRRRFLRYRPGLGQCRQRGVGCCAGK